MFDNVCLTVFGVVLILLCVICVFDGFYSVGSACRG